jgi:hypothetical protein
VQPYDEALDKAESIQRDNGIKALTRDLNSQHKENEERHNLEEANKMAHLHAEAHLAKESEKMQIKVIDEVLVPDLEKRYRAKIAQQLGQGQKLP